MRTEKIDLKKVEFMPMEQEQGTLYVSKKYKVAAHLCPCGCGNKVVTPLGPTEWWFSEEENKPTLYPSLGNWQLPCRSHYWILFGEIEWSYQWTEDQIEAGQKNEELRRQFYYEMRAKRKKN